MVTYGEVGVGKSRPEKTLEIFDSSYFNEISVMGIEKLKEK